MALTMVGTQTPQKLFSDLPAQTFPGAVTPNITAAMPSNVDWADIVAAQNMQKAQSRASWARAAAASAPQPDLDDEKAKLKDAFFRLYGPQVQNNYNDLMVQQEEAGQIPRRFGTTTHMPNMYSSNRSVADWANPNAPAGGSYAEGKSAWGPYRLEPDQLTQRLESMWQQRTDPYQMMAMRMGRSGMGGM